ncbi:arif-1 [Catopsilia pomona nucleopolyhedrovirus]|uniref:Arif-1 n=1 Tax=Catopsilia pomona nucleopolyhedrovirus TaxID=1850906 RepID=A0A172WZI8_9ABAC|nr:arif-1 [Catopsilia pomona nucleopolyhedrovirus]ANF29766.1 arif-1 [Catopsilia pomona nucleopolyhedrovirus]
MSRQQITILILQHILDFVVIIIYLLIFIFSTMGVTNNKYALLLEIENKQAVINLSIPMMLTFGVWLTFYVVYYSKKTIVYLVENFQNYIVKHRRRRSCFNYTTAQTTTTTMDSAYIKSVAILINVLILICWFLFATFQVYIYKNGHIPILDVLYRDYDTTSLCWSGHQIGFVDFNKIYLNCVDVENALMTKHAIQKSCVFCRNAIRPDEPTVFNQNFVTITLCVFIVLILQCRNVYVQFKNNCRDIVQNQNYNSSSDDNVITYKRAIGDDDIYYYGDNSNNNDTIIENSNGSETDEERHSELKCFRQIARARNADQHSLSTTTTVSSPPSILSFYDTPRTTSSATCLCSTAISKPILRTSPPPPPPKSPFLSARSSPLLGKRVAPPIINNFNMPPPPPLPSSAPLSFAAATLPVLTTTTTTTTKRNNLSPSSLLNELNHRIQLRTN